MTVNQATTHLLWSEYNPAVVRDYIDCCVQTVLGKAYFQNFTFEILIQDYLNFCKENNYDI